MINRYQYMPGPANKAQVIKDESKDKWTLILVRELRHSPEKVWQALTDPAQLREWAPFVVDGNMSEVGASVNLTWVGNPTTPIPTKVTRADAHRALEYGDIRWELEKRGSGTRLTQRRAEDADGADHDRDRADERLLQGRGLSPAVPGAEPVRLLRARRHRRELPDRQRRSRYRMTTTDDRRRKCPELRFSIGRPPSVVRPLNSYLPCRAAG